MRVLLLDKTTEGQAFLADKINGISAADQDSLDLQMSLASESDYVNRLETSDVILIGSEFLDQARLIAREVRSKSADIEIIVFVKDASYDSSVFRNFAGSRIRKVIPNSCSELDLLQELVTIQEGLRERGRMRGGRVILLLQPKGGVGTTTIAAALGEAALESPGNVLLWDMDIDSCDLTRAINALSVQSKVVSEWIHEGNALSRDQFKSGVVTVKDRLGLLPPPDHIPTMMDYVGHPEVVEIIQRMLSIARIQFDTIIVDSAGRIGPAVGSLVQSADEVVMVVEDTLLGLSAAQWYFTSFQPLFEQAESIRILCSGVKLTREEMAESLDHALLEKYPMAWSLPRIPFEPTANLWAGSDSTIFSLGSSQTKHALRLIMHELGIGQEPAPPPTAIHKKKVFRARDVLSSVMQKVAHS